MRKITLFFVIVSLFMLIPASITRAQKMTQEKGLTTAVFNVSQGTVKVYLPDDIRQGDMISGTVTATPEGRNEKQMQRNMAELARYGIVFNGQKFGFDPASRSFRFMVPAVNSPQSSIALLFDKEPNPVQQLNIPAKPLSEQKPAPVQCVIPGHVLTGSPMNIPGPFDGNASNTQCSIGNQPAPILAESPRNCIVSFPGDANGMQATSVKENGQEACSKNVSAVQMNVSAGKLNLQKGESTYIDVSITGLQGLEQTALLNLTNLTTGTVVLQPSNIISIPLIPGDVSTGNFNQRFNVQSIRTGGFTVNVNLDFQDIMLTPVPEDKNKSKCNCSVTATIIKPTTINFRGFHAMLQKNCSGQNCSEANITKKWEVVSGRENIETADISNDNESITVQPKGEGPFTLKFSATLTCSDGSSCTTIKYCNEKGDEVPGPADGGKTDEPKYLIVGDNKFRLPVDSIPDKKVKSCSRSTGDETLPKMDGGLVTGKIPASQTIKRDDFIALNAEGADFDTYIIQCSPTELCVEASTVKLIPLSGRVKFEWQIKGGPGFGQFVKLGCSYAKGGDGQLTEGEQVIFMPPFVPLAVFPMKETIITTEIELRIIDDKATLKDETVIRPFTIITRRNIEKPEEYMIDIKYEEKVKCILPTPVSKNVSGACEAKAGSWIKSADLTIPKVLLPDVPESNKTVLGQWIVLEAENQQETDILPDIDCGTACSEILSFSNEFEDNLQWSWEVTGTGKEKGKFVAGETGRFVIYQLPEKMDVGKTEMEFSIRVKVFNPDGTQAKDVDPKSEKPKKDSFIWSSVVTVKVYQPGVKLSQSPEEFLPTDNNSVNITSQLMIKEKEWIPAPAHTCRIHYFELFDVSNEKGICMNSPLHPDEANSCRDLKIKNEKEHEAYDTVKQAGCPDIASYFMQARTQKPKQSYTINIYSEDFGSWGFLRSFANVNEESNKKEEQKPFNEFVKKPGMTPAQLAAYAKGLAVYEKQLSAYYALKEKHRNLELPYYISIPFKFDNKDNRVSIPLDMNNNHIADAGWKASENEINDPVKGDWDDDKEPVGNGVKGDGFTNYEEYRGFMTTPKSLEKGDGESVNTAEAVHVRTNPEIKTLFIHRVDEDLDLSLFKELSKLELHLVNETQYNSDLVIGGKAKNVKKRWMNFNYTNASNVIEQFGLKLVDHKKYEPKPGWLGIAANTEWELHKIETATVPNWEFEIRIFTEAIRDVCTKRGLTYKEKLKQVVAHEMLHGCNVCHHGESEKGGTGGSTSEEFNKPKPGGLRSGDIYCVMRYDNAGDEEVPGYVPEHIGKRLCTSFEGTDGIPIEGEPIPKSYNKSVIQYKADGKRILHINLVNYGDAALGRGDCLHQIQVSARGGQPASCRQNEWRKFIFDIPKAKK